MAVTMNIRDIGEADRPEWVRLRASLWSGSLADHEAETRRYFEQPPDGAVVLVAEVDGRVVGFLEMGLRPDAPGCRSSPVPFIEGWFVDPSCRRLGIGRGLVRAAEARARAMGHDEIASDAEIGNAEGIAAHLRLGYQEVERVVSFRRSLGDGCHAPSSGGTPP